MTEKLKTLLHERATSIDFAAPDLDAMARAGDHTLRRRRSLAVVGGLAAAAVLVGGTALLSGVGGTADRDVATGPAAEAAPLTWVTGSTLHVGPDRTVDLGHDVRAYVPTGEGYVSVDGRGTVWSWQDGTSTDIGLTTRTDPHLVVDPDTATVAFVDGGEGPGQVVVFDQTRGAADLVPTAGGRAELYALDAGQLYLRDARGLVAVDVSFGSQEVLTSAGGLDVTDVEAGVHAATTGQGTVVGPRPGEGVTLPEAYGSAGVLSPDGRYYSSEGDEQAVFDTTTGERVRLDLEQRFATGYEWLDDSTLAVFAAAHPRMDATAQLVTCSVPDGACRTVVDDLGTFEELDGFALPTGDDAG